jgi:hypothetical protein
MERILSIQGQAQSQWEFEEQDISMAANSMILVRVIVGKIKDLDRLVSILKSTATKGGQPGWNCVEWVREALEALDNDGKVLGTSVTDWQTIRDAALQYVRHKEAQHRFDGKAQPGQFDTSRVPTYDLVGKKMEIVP